MATSFIGPRLTDRASAAAPEPRPPQPTRANWIVLFSPAYMRGPNPAARVETAAIRPVFFRNSRRDVLFCVLSLIAVLSYWRLPFVIYHLRLPIYNLSHGHAQQYYAVGCLLSNGTVSFGAAMMSTTMLRKSSIHVLVISLAIA